jgi:hypothetical protein
MHGLDALCLLARQYHAHCLCSCSQFLCSGHRIHVRLGLRSFRRCCVERDLKHFCSPQAQLDHADESHVVLLLTPGCIN